MANRSILAVASLALFGGVSICRAQSGCEIPFELQDHLILIRGSIGKMTGLRFAVDTGATHTVVDRKLAERLGLQLQSEEVVGRAFGQTIKLGRVFIHELRIGPLVASAYCYDADLSGLRMGLDGLIGLDLLQGEAAEFIDSRTQQGLGGRSLTIDYESGKMRFGQTQSLEHEVPMEIEKLRIVVVANILGQPARLVLDTGFPITILYKGRQGRWIDLPRFDEAVGSGLGGATLAPKVLLERFQLGTGRWKDLPALVLDAPDQPNDGVLAVAPLKLKILYVDFERNVLGWRK